MRLHLPVCLSFLGLLMMPASGEETSVASASELRAAIAQAKPGDTIRIAPGQYPGGNHFSRIHGSPEKPITISGSDPNDPPIFSSRLGGRTGIQLSACSHLYLKDLSIEGFAANGVNIDDGGERTKPSKGIKLSRITIRQTGPRGNHDALKLSGLKDFAIENCSFAGWGGSAIDMVGCHNGIVSHCRLEGMQNFTQQSGIQMKGGTSGILVTHSSFIHAGQRAINMGGSTGLPYFRPPDSTWEARDIEVTQNHFIGSMSPVAWVGIDGGHFHHNHLYLPDKWVGRILQENTNPGFGKCRNGKFEHNLIVFDSRVRTFFNIGPNTDPDSFQVRGNAWYCPDEPARTPTSLPVKETQGIYGVNPNIEIDRKAGTIRIRSNDARFRGIGVSETK